MNSKLLAWLPGKIRFVAAWYDFWIGIFWDGRKRHLYLLPVPCLGICLEWPKRCFRVTDGEKYFACYSYWNSYDVIPEDGNEPFSCLDISTYGLRKC